MVQVGIIDIKRRSEQIFHSFALASRLSYRYVRC